jgi:molecular chaperone HtpG
VTAEQYEQFYEQVLGGFEKPLATIHSKAEGVTEYNALLFLPEKLSFDLLSWERKHGVKLYVKRVFIMDNCKELLPEYLRFVKGIVDSEDLPLNVSRELLQNNPLIGRIRGGLVARILSRLAELADKEPTRYTAFWKQFGPVLKEGLHSDFENRDKLLPLLRFSSSTAGKEELVSLKQYVERMRPEQKDIYYLAGESRELVEKSPHMEVFRAKSIEVLFCVDPVDEFVVPGIGTFSDKKLVDITRGDLDLGDLGKDAREAQKKAEGELRTLAERIKNILADVVKEVRVTTRLTDSPCCLVIDTQDMGAHMERLMKAMGREYSPAKPILEINGTHPILLNMNKLYAKNAKDPNLDEWARLLYEQALVAEGQNVPDPLAYSKRVHGLLLRVSGEAASALGTR